MNCLFCEEELTSKAAKKFCNRSCSAKYNNAKRRKIRSCIQCDAPLVGKQGRNRRYCSRSCNKIYDLEQNRIPMMEAGMISSRKGLKRCLVHLYGWQCNVCRSTKWMGKDIPLELDHIDGDATNNFPDNLQLICPNCHAQTDTYKGRNVGRGRQSRGLRSC